MQMSDASKTATRTEPCVCVRVFLCVCVCGEYVRFDAEARQDQLQVCVVIMSVSLLYVKMRIVSVFSPRLFFLRRQHKKTLA